MFRLLNQYDEVEESDGENPPPPVDGGVTEEELRRANEAATEGTGVVHNPIVAVVDDVVDVDDAFVDG